MSRQLPDEALGVLQGDARIDVERHAHRALTISWRGVDPSTACQISVATSFKLNRVESRTDMMTISSPSRRAAISELGATYTLLTE